MKKLFFTVACAALIMTACNNKSQEGESHETTTEQKDGGVEVQGSEGGSMEVNKEGVSIEGKDGGSLKVDESGVSIEGKNGGSVEVNTGEEKK